MDGIDSSKLHVRFVDHSVTNQAIRKLSEIDSGHDEFRALRKEVFVHCRHGYGRTKLSNNRIEKVLAAEATTRNWNTVKKLYEMLAT